MLFWCKSSWLKWSEHVWLYAFITLNDYTRICLAYMRLIWPTVTHGWSSVCDDERVWLVIERENFNKNRWSHVAFMLMKWMLTTLLCSILLTIHPQLCPKQAIGCVTLQACYDEALGERVTRSLPFNHYFLSFHSGNNTITVHCLLLEQ